MSEMLVAFLLIGAALVVLVGLAIAIDRAQASERQRLDGQRRVQAAERDIAEIGRQTRAAIFDEVQRRLWQGRS